MKLDGIDDTCMISCALARCLSVAFNPASAFQTGGEANRENTYHFSSCFLPMTLLYHVSRIFQVEGIASSSRSSKL